MSATEDGSQCGSAASPGQGEGSFVPLIGLCDFGLCVLSPPGARRGLRDCHLQGRLERARNSMRFFQCDCAGAGNSPGRGRGTATAEQGRAAGRQGGRAAGRQGGRAAGRQGGRAAGRQGGRAAGRQGGRAGHEIRCTSSAKRISQYSKHLTAPCDCQGCRRHLSAPSYFVDLFTLGSNYDSDVADRPTPFDPFGQCTNFSWSGP